ncbi:MAG: M23 family metallopeptidase [Roseivirga sp.]|nr:M23 family metallopeptidase [Roseivirga sp.]
MTKKITRFLSLLLILLTVACAGGSDDSIGNVTPGNGVEECQNGNCTEFIPSYPIYDREATFPNWFASPYKLPYAVGSTFQINQGNTSGFGHSGFWQYGYDFTMCIGTQVLAARDGTVVHANDGAGDGDRNNTNLITIQHHDGTVALYSHLTRNGVFVTAGAEVKQGDVIGLSGDTGNTGGLPHLHFSVHPCTSLPGLVGSGTDCSSIPVNFLNTESNPFGLGSGRCYTAK